MVEEARSKFERKASPQFKQDKLPLSSCAVFKMHNRHRRVYIRFFYFEKKTFFLCKKLAFCLCKGEALRRRCVSKNGALTQNSIVVLKNHSWFLRFPQKLRAWRHLGMSLSARICVEKILTNLEFQHMKFLDILQLLVILHSQRSSFEA